MLRLSLVHISIYYCCCRPQNSLLKPFTRYTLCFCPCFCCCCCCFSHSATDHLYNYSNSPHTDLIRMKWNAMQTYCNNKYCQLTHIYLHTHICNTHRYALICIATVLLKKSVERYSHLPTNDGCCWRNTCLFSQIS